MKPLARSLLSRRTAPDLPRRDAALLLPKMEQGHRAPALVVSRSARAAARSGADVVLLEGRDRRGELRSAGYQVTEWWSRRTVDRGVVARAGPRPPRLPAEPGIRRRDILRGARATTVAARGPSGPGVLHAAGMSAAHAELVVSGDPRRRAVFRLRDDSGHVRSVVKVTRSPGEEARGAKEQQVLRALAGKGVVGVPQPLGHGTVGTLSWSAETGAPGTPLHGWLEQGAARGTAELVALAEWLGDVAVSTVGRPSWASTGADEPLPLRGEARQERSLLGALTGVPGVLAHGDLASGLNVLVTPDGGRTVLDWETALWGAPPLLDLIPLLCLGLARARGARGAVDECAAVMRLGRGEHPDSGLLRRLVREHVVRLRLAPASVGPLALLAWAYQASMRAVHDELLVAAGLPVPPWVSAAELVLPVWRSDPALGAGWNPAV